MKVILLVDDKKLGKRNTVIDVADGYARNVLIPKKVVEPATNENINKLNNRVAKEQYEFKNKLNEAIKTSKDLQALKDIEVTLQSSDSGKVFGSVTSKIISEKLAEHGFNISKQEILLNKPIKDFGNYPVSIKLFGGQTVINKYKCY